MIPKHLFTERVVYPPKALNAEDSKSSARNVPFMSSFPSLHEAFSDLLCYYSAIKVVFFFGPTLVEESCAGHLHIFSNTYQSRAYYQKSKKTKGENPNELIQTKGH